MELQQTCVAFARKEVDYAGHNHYSGPKTDAIGPKRLPMVPWQISPMMHLLRVENECVVLQLLKSCIVCFMQLPSLPIFP